MGLIHKVPDYCVSDVRHRGGKNLIRAFGGSVGSCRFDVKRKIQAVFLQVLSIDAKNSDGAFS